MKWTSYVTAQAVELLEAGHSHREISGLLPINVTENAVRVKLQRLGKRATREVPRIRKSCLHCHNDFLSREMETRRFCSHSCSASYNNSRRSRTPKKKGACLNCNGPRNRNTTTFCSYECFHIYRRNDRIKSGEFSPRMIKRYLMEQEHRCRLCQNTSWNGQPIPLELDHINGDASNNTLSNLRLLCPNCHAQTPTYKGKNTGNGRAFRRERYHQGKSY